MTGDGGSNGFRRELSLDLPAAHRAVRVARNVVRHFARLEGLVDQEVEYLVLVVSELLANAIDHGGGESAMTESELASDVRMQLAYVIEGKEWRLSVSDQGGGDPEELRQMLAPDGMPDLEDDRGRGLFLLAQMVDRMEVERSADGRGLTIHAIKTYGA